MIKKNGRQIVVLMDIDVYKAFQENLREEAFIEEYTEGRIREFLAEDRIDRSVVEKVKTFSE